jgi:hypothetical protein
MDELIQYARDAVAHLSDDRLKVEGHSDSSSIKEYLTGKDLLDMAFLDVVIKDGLNVASKLRKTNKETELLLLADATVSPMQYINPSIRASHCFCGPLLSSRAMTSYTAFSGLITVIMSFRMSLIFYCSRPAMGE